LSMLLPMQALSDQRVTSEFGRTINMLATSSPEVFLCRDRVFRQRTFKRP